ncbi:MAG: hypothetical protein V1846_00670 [Candidatus Komeilibacteria bacterium]
MKFIIIANRVVNILIVIFIPLAVIVAVNIIETTSIIRGIILFSALILVFLKPILFFWKNLTQPISTTPHDKRLDNIGTFIFIVPVLLAAVIVNLVFGGLVYAGFLFVALVVGIFLIFKMR